jgi:NitT/TauT family transport system permease protein
VTDATDIVDAELPAQLGGEPARSESWRARVLPPVVAFFVVLGVLYFISLVIMNENRRKVALPPPHRILSDALLTWDGRMEKIMSSLGTTARVALLGLVISTVLGVLIAIIMNSTKKMERAIFPYAVIAQTVPVIALTPLIKIWYGSGVNSRVIVCVLIAIFPTITNALFGLQSVDTGQRELFKLHNASWWTRLWKLELPSALPAIFTGLRIAAGGCVIGAIVGDFFFRKGDLGIGRLIDNSTKAGADATLLFGATIMASLLGVLLFVIIGYVQYRTLRNWHDSVRAKT